MIESSNKWIKIVDFERIQILIESEGDFCKLDLNLSAREAIKKVIKDMTCGQGLLCAFELFCSFIAQNFNDTIKGSHYQCSEQHKGARGHDVNDMLLHYCRFARLNHPLLVPKGRFTFNSGRNGTKVRRTRKTGSPTFLWIYKWMKTPSVNFHFSAWTKEHL